MAVRVVDAANVRVVAGTEGKLQCRGPFQFVGYLKQADVARQSYSNGWFDTGDFAVMDGDGYIRITGRARTSSSEAARKFRSSMSRTFCMRMSKSRTSHWLQCRTRDWARGRALL